MAPENPGKVLVLMLDRQVPITFAPVVHRFHCSGEAALCRDLANDPAAVAAYLLQGAAGLPLFATGVGWAALTGPAGGYLVGFLAAAVVIPLTLGRGAAGPARIVAARLAGNVAIYLFGVPWLDRFVHGNLIAAINLGMTPFLIVDAIKLRTAAAVSVAAGSTRRTL